MIQSDPSGCRVKNTLNQGAMDPSVGDVVVQTGAEYRWPRTEDSGTALSHLAVKLGATVSLYVTLRDPCSHHPPTVHSQSVGDGWFH